MQGKRVGNQEPYATLRFRNNGSIFVWIFPIKRAYTAARIKIYLDHFSSPRNENNKIRNIWRSDNRKRYPTYSFEVWPIKESNEKMLKATKMSFWWKAAGNFNLESIRNETIRDITEENRDIMEYTTIVQLSHFTTDDPRTNT